MRPIVQPIARKFFVIINACKHFISFNIGFYSPGHENTLLERLVGRGTGAKLNGEKSEAMWVGSYRSRLDKPYGLKWVAKIKILGTWFGDNVEDENWVAKCEKLKGIVRFVEFSSPVNSG